MKNTKKFTNRSKVKRFIRHMKKTYRNKLFALACVSLGVGSIILLEGDATFALLMVIMGGIAFTEKNDIWEKESD